MKLYYENHLGERIDFNRPPYILAEHGLFNWKLDYTTVNNRSTNFHLKSVERPMTIRLMPKARTGFARQAMFAELYDRFVDIISADVDTPGRLITDGGEYLTCRIVSDDKANWNLDRNVNLSCKVLIDKPVWQKAVDYRFDRIDNVETETSMLYEYLDYPHDYLYDYQGVLQGNKTVGNIGTEAADYIMTIYGAVQDPLVIINGINVGAYVTLGQGEKLVISTRDNTVVKWSGDIQTNMFNQRYKGERSMFERLPTGDVSISWSGNFVFDITVLSERREPKWI